MHLNFINQNVMTNNFNNLTLRDLINGTEKPPVYPTEKLFWYLEILKKAKNVVLNDKDVATMFNGLNKGKFYTYTLPRYVYHTSYLSNRQSILENGLLAFGNRCTGVFANLSNITNPYIITTPDFYPSIWDDTCIAQNRLDIWQIDTYKLPSFTWMLDDYSRFEEWIYTFNNIPTFALQLFKAKKENFLLGNPVIFVEGYRLLPVKEVNQKLKKLKRTKIYPFF